MLFIVRWNVIWMQSKQPADWRAIRSSFCYRRRSTHDESVLGLFVCCRWSHKNLLLSLEWEYWLECRIGLNENTNLKHSRSRSTDVHAIEKDAFMQWLLSRGTIVFHHLCVCMYDICLFIDSTRRTREKLFVSICQSFAKAHMQLITAKKSATQRPLFIISSDLGNN